MCLAALQPMPFPEYAALGALNASRLVDFSVSPLLYRHRLTEPRPDSAALLAGRAAHTAILEPERFAVDYAVYDGKRQGKAWEEFKAKHADRSLITRGEYDKATAIAAAVRRHRVAHGYLSDFDGRPEQTIVWTQRVGTGSRLCKARLDWLINGRAIVDVKTTRDASPRRFGWSCRDYSYLTRMAWYRRAAYELTRAWLPCVLVAVESSAPHDVAVYRLQGDQLDAEDERTDALLDELAACERTGTWPGRWGEEMTLDVPGGGADEDDVSGLGIEVGGATI